MICCDHHHRTKNMPRHPLFGDAFHRHCFGGCKTSTLIPQPSPPNSYSTGNNQYRRRGHELKSCMSGRFKCFASCRLSDDFCGTVSAFSIINLLWLFWGGHDLLALVSTDLWLKVATPFRISSHPAAVVSSSHWPIALLGHLRLWCTEATTLTPRSSRTKNWSQAAVWSQTFWK